MKALAFLQAVAFWFVVISLLAVPVVMAYWRHNERLRAEQTEKTLESLGYDTSHEHEQDAM